MLVNGSAFAQLDHEATLQALNAKLLQSSFVMSPACGHVIWL